MPNKQGNHAGPEVDLFPAAEIPRFKRFSGGSRRPQIPPHLPGFHPESSGLTRFSIFPLIFTYFSHFTYFHPFYAFSPPLTSPQSYNISHISPIFAIFTYFHTFHTFPPPPLLPPLDLGRGAGQKSMSFPYLADFRVFSPHLKTQFQQKYPKYQYFS